MVAFSSKTLAQDVVWKKRFGNSDAEVYYSVVAVPGGTVAAGTSTGDWRGVSERDAIVVKHDNDGNLLWKKNFGGNAEDQYNAITAVPDGVVAVGLSVENSFGSGDWSGVTTNGWNDAIIVKYDFNGKVVWKKNFGGNDLDYFNSATAVSDGIVVVGASYPNSFGNGDFSGIAGRGYIDAVIVKYDNAGNLVWKKNFGGNNVDGFGSVTTISDDIVVVGASFVTSFGNGDWVGVTGKGMDDAIIVKYKNGNGSTGITDTGIDNLIVYTQNQSILIANAQSQPVKIMNLTGITLVNKTVDTPVAEFYMADKGVYLVVAGGKAHKVVVH